AGAAHVGNAAVRGGGAGADPARRDIQAAVAVHAQLSVHGPVRARAGDRGAAAARRADEGVAAGDDAAAGGNVHDPRARRPVEAEGSAEVEDAGLSPL